jgi:hypothetical protein
LRFLIGVLALGAIVFGWLAPTFPWGISLGLQSAVIMGAGFLALAVAVFMPAVREVELGISPTVKLGPALSNRQAELRSVFEQQKGDLEYCAHLLCDDPGEARRLLEAAWSQVAGTWVGPVTPQPGNAVVTWASSRPIFAAVDQGGLVRGAVKGEAVITARADGVSSAGVRVVVGPQAPDPGPVK